MSIQDFKPDFSGLAKNPIKVQRDARKLRQMELASRTFLSINTIRDLERGQASRVPAALLDFFDVKSLDTDYELWKRAKRTLVYLPPVASLKISLDSHPLAQYIEQLGITVNRFCEFLCLPRFPILKYLDNQRIMPKVLRYTALPQAHLSEFDIARLARLGETYFEKRETAKNNEITNNR